MIHVSRLPIFPIKNSVSLSASSAPIRSTDGFLNEVASRSSSVSLPPHFPKHGLRADPAFAPDQLVAFVGILLQTEEIDVLP